MILNSISMSLGFKLTYLCNTYHMYKESREQLVLYYIKCKGDIGWLKRPGCKTKRILLQMRVLRFKIASLQIGIPFVQSVIQILRMISC